MSMTVILGQLLLVSIACLSVLHLLLLLGTHAKAEEVTCDNTLSVNKSLFDENLQVCPLLFMGKCIQKTSTAEDLSSRIVDTLFEEH